MYKNQSEQENNLRVLGRIKQSHNYLKIPYCLEVILPNRE